MNPLPTRMLSVPSASSSTSAATPTSSSTSLPSIYQNHPSHEEKEQLTLPISFTSPTASRRTLPSNSSTSSSLSPRPPLSPTSKAVTSNLMREAALAKSSFPEGHYLPPPYHLRVSAVLLQCLDHLSLVSTLLSTPSPSSSPLPSLDMYTLLQHHHQLSSLFSSLHIHRSSLSGLSNRAKLLSLQSSLTLLSRHLTSSIASMSQQLQLSTDDRAQEKKNRTDLDHLIGIIKRGREELTHGHYDSLYHEVEEEEMSGAKVKQVKEASEKATQQITSLQQLLASEDAAYQSTLTSLQSQVSTAHSQLSHHRTLITHTVKFDQQSLAAKAESMSRVRRVRLEELERSIGELKRRMRESGRVHKYNTTYMGWVKGRVEKDLSDWNERYDSEVGNDRERYTELLVKRNEEMKGLVERQREWEEDEKRRREELREREEMEREEREGKEDERRRDLAARKIQFAFRVYWRRRKVQLKKLHKSWIKKQKAAQK